MGSVLDRIVEGKRAAVEALAGREAELRAAAAAAPPPRSLATSLRREEVALIAEVKRRSPSAGWIRREADVAQIAAAYEAAGAAAVSVLTDAEDFGGSLADLERVRRAVGVPVLRKDFVVAPVQLWEARAAGADAVLLIVRILGADRLTALLDVAAEAGLAALVETHDEGELEVAVEAGAEVIGINSRDLATFRTDLGVACRLAPAVPPDRVVVAESGIHRPLDVARVASAGADAVLVGESLMRADAPGEAAGRLVGVPRVRRPLPLAGAASGAD